jgi:mannose-6-phosphate isomerase-like protein (cupin superfamily)
MAIFESFDFRHGLLCDLTADAFPAKLSAWMDDALELPAGATHFGHVFEGKARLSCASGEFSLGRGMYFAAPSAAVISGQSRGVVLSSPGFKGMFQIGGPIEAEGRLKYIDGCTDSLLIPPVLKGDPCLNYLHFPPNVRQTPHTHPSHRLGMIVGGAGLCVTPEETVALDRGRIFIIRAGGVHSFHTRDSELSVIAYHPDSDFGAAHEDHPMINRTMIDGISAATLTAIQTP